MPSIKSVMIGPAGTVDLHVTSKTGYEERQQWKGREGADTALFEQWLNAFESSPNPCPAFRRHALFI